METIFAFLLLCGILLYAYDIFILRKKGDEKKNKKKNKNVILDVNNNNSLDDVLTVVDK